MKVSGNIFGAFAFAVVIMAAIVWQHPPGIFWNLPSILLVVAGGSALCIASNGSGVYRRIQQALRSTASLADLEEAKAIADSGRRQFFLAGWIGTLIGIIQMLQVLDDPQKIGPSLAVALLTVFFVQMIAALFWNPLTRHFDSRAIQRRNEQT